VNADLVVALVAGGIGIVTLVLIPFQIAGESIAAIGNLQSPAFFPVFSGIAIIICAGILAARSLAATAAGGLHVTFPRLPFVAAVSGIFVLFAAGSLVIGMIPASAVMIFVLAYLWDYRDFRILVPVAVLVPLAIYLLFEKTLLIILPRGVVFG
jgi:hypothetical protein